MADQEEENEWEVASLAVRSSTPKARVRKTAEENKKGERDERVGPGKQKQIDERDAWFWSKAVKASDPLWETIGLLPSEAKQQESEKENPTHWARGFRTEAGEEERHQVLPRSPRQIENWRVQEWEDTNNSERKSKASLELWEGLA